MNGTQERSGEVIRSAASKVIWVGRATVFLVGLAVILALVFGAAATALAGTGVGATFNLGKTNTVDRVSSLVGSHAKSMLVIDNNGSGSALDIRVGPSTATPANNNVTPMKVNSQKKVANLNADEVDGLDSSLLVEPRGYAQVNVTSASVTVSVAKGINGVQRSTTDNSVYCFDLTFLPKTAVASAHINNDSTVGTGLGDSVPAGCPAGFRDAAARTYGSDAVATSQVNFRIIFI